MHVKCLDDERFIVTVREGRKTLYGVWLFGPRMGMSGRWAAEAGFNSDCVLSLEMAQKCYASLTDSDNPKRVSPESIKIRLLRPRLGKPLSKKQMKMFLENTG